MSHLSESFVASIARALNAAQVPCILWGQYLLNVHGVPSIIAADERLRAASKALVQFKNLIPCPDQKRCPSSSLERPTPPPAFHMHIKNEELTVALYPQSETLWFLPPLEESPLLFPQVSLELPSQFILASDQNTLPPWRPGRGSGVFKSSDDPVVVVVKSHILLEAFMRMYARDSGTLVGSCALPMIAYMMEYVDDDGLLDTDLLPEPLRTSYMELKETEKPIRQWTMELKEALGVPLPKGF